MKRHSRELSSQMSAKILKHKQAEKFHFLKSHSKKLEASSFNNIKWIGFYRLIKLRFCMGQNTGYVNRANQRYSFLFSLKKVASKIDEHIMLSYFNKRLESDFFFQLHPKFPRARAKQTH